MTSAAAPEQERGRKPTKWMFGVAGVHRPRRAALRLRPGCHLGRAANWFAAFLVTEFFLPVADAIGESTTFFIFAAMCAGTWVFVDTAVPETRGRSLEEIQADWQQST
jgi:Sugar (and other) transporter